MMHNADQIMTAEGVAVEQIATLLKLPLEVMRSRPYGDGSCMVREALFLKDMLFPKRTLDALFGSA